jgi:competence ComEA-like helix-hairpin-helix protein
MNTIDLNTAGVKDLTQLPGVSKDIAYHIVNHRNRHGYFTAWEELLEVKGFPEKKLEWIKQRAILGHPKDEPGAFTPPRHLQSHLPEESKKPKGYTRAIRATRRADKLRQAAGPRH